MKAFLFIALSQSVLNASPLNIDPQREDTNLQQEQTHDIQFEEDKNFKQERELGR